MDNSSFPEPDAADIELGGVLRALSDPIRLRILAVLSDGNYHACRPDEFELGIQKSTLSHHLKTMREAGITTRRVRGRNSDVTLRRETLDRRFPGLVAAVLLGVADGSLSA